MPGDSPPTPDQVTAALAQWRVSYDHYEALPPHEPVIVAAARDWLRIQEEGQSLLANCCDPPCALMGMTRLSRADMLDALINTSEELEQTNAWLEEAETIWWCEVRRAEDKNAYKRTVPCHININGYHDKCGERRLI